MQAQSPILPLFHLLAQKAMAHQYKAKRALE